MSRRMKTKIAHIQGALGGWLEHEGVQGWMVVPSAITFPWSRTSGWENGSRCQWWSSLFWIRRVTPEELHSLSKTTKLLLLDSLLQEVCIESGSDGSLALSSLGLSVCLVSHNLLYSGLKKARLHNNKSCLCSKICLFGTVALCCDVTSGRRFLQPNLHLSPISFYCLSCSLQGSLQE